MDRKDPKGKKGKENNESRNSGMEDREQTRNEGRQNHGQSFTENQGESNEDTENTAITSQPRSRNTRLHTSTQNSGRQQPPPRPPSYYTNTYSPSFQDYGTPVASVPPGQAVGPVAFFRNPISDFSYWAPYPPNIPPGIPPGLAHLLSVDSVIIVQQVNLIELFLDLAEACRFMVLNSDGLCIFYAYETSGFCSRFCCGDGRPLQIHVKDLYHNEIIYMNRLCSCTSCCSSCCCLSALEVYTIPLNPVGAVIQTCYLKRVQFNIVNVDENVMFKIEGPSPCMLSGCCYEAEFTIHALDAEKSEVGIIRKQWGGTFREMLSSADLYTVSFPKDLDVQIKAIFLGAMFLINYMYNED